MVSFLYFNMNREITIKDRSRFDDVVFYIDIAMDNYYTKRLIDLCKDYYFIRVRANQIITTVEDNILRNIDCTVYDETNIPIGIVENIYIIHTTTGQHLSETNHWDYRKFEEKLYIGEYLLAFNIKINNFDIMETLSDNDKMIKCIYITSSKVKNPNNDNRDIRLNIKFNDYYDERKYTIHDNINAVYTMTKIPLRN